MVESRDNSLSLLLLDIFDGGILQIQKSSTFDFFLELRLLWFFEEQNAEVIGRFELFNILIENYLFLVFKDQAEVAVLCEVQETAFAKDGELFYLFARFAKRRYILEKLGLF